MGSSLAPIDDADAPFEYFRVDRSGGTRRVLAFAACLIAVGATAVGATFVRRVSEVLGQIIALGGGLCVLGGLVIGFGSMAAVVMENAYLALTRRGVVLHTDADERCITWDALKTARADRDAGIVELELDDGELVAWFAGPVCDDIAKRVAEAHRRAIHRLPLTSS
ncbi:MAG: hypothetical protein KC657_13155 [Myxococcales bacterium]|nr:hypothetical protein [Myxococcales bacterium]